MKTLFIGNGINRCSSDNVAWDALLTDAAADYSLNSIAGVPLPIEFERMAKELSESMLFIDESDNGHNPYDCLKGYIEKQLSTDSLEINDLYKNLASADIDNIITTNYDKVIEKSFPELDWELDGKSARRYLTKRTSVSNGCSIYHAHGIAGYPNTMCLGYEHYVDYTKELSNRLFSKPKNCPYTPVDRLISEGIRTDAGWADLFFISDVDIVGFGLDYSEVDIWWLLSARAKQMVLSEPEMRPRNQIRYWALSGSISSSESPDETKKRELLSGLGVKVCKQPATNYRDGYSRILNRILDAM